jgi:hypothetical protein
MIYMFKKLKLIEIYQSKYLIICIKEWFNKEDLTFNFIYFINIILDDMIRL